MTDPDLLRRLVQGLTGLPLLPDAVDRLRRRLDGGRATAREMAALAAGDPALAAMVLRAANTLFFGPPRRVAALPAAVRLLGLHAVQAIALNVPAFDPGPGNGAWSALARHGAGTGLAARAVARVLGYDALDELQVAGLLHDIGKVALDRHRPADAAAARRKARRDRRPLVEAERAVLGVTHAETGAWLLEAWGLPRGLVDVARWHHAPAEAPANGRPAALVHVANALCAARGFGDGGDGVPPAVDPAAWTLLGAGSARQAEAAEAVGAELARAAADGEGTSTA